MESVPAAADASPRSTSTEPMGDELRRHRLEYFSKNQKFKRKPGRLWANTGTNRPARRTACQTTSTTEGDIELQSVTNRPPRPPSPVASISDAALPQSPDTPTPDPPLTATGRVGKWLWDKAYTVWGWLVSVVMVALTAITYLVAKLQTAGDAMKQAWDKYMVRSQVWRNAVALYDHCKGEKDSGQQLSHGCDDILKKGIPPQPAPPASAVDGPLERRSVEGAGRRLPWVSELYAKAKRAVSDMEQRAYDVVGMLNSGFDGLGVYGGGGSLRKRQ